MTETVLNSLFLCVPDRIYINLRTRLTVWFFWSGWEPARGTEGRPSAICSRERGTNEKVEEVCRTTWQRQVGLVSAAARGEKASF